MSSKNMAAEYHTMLIYQQLDQPGCFSLNHGPFVLTERHASNAVIDAFFAQLLLCFAHMRQRRVGKSRPGDGAIIKWLGIVSKGVTRRQFTLLSGNVGELVASRYITRRPDMGNIGTQRSINFDALFASFDSCGFQAQRLQLRATTESQQRFINHQFLFCALLITNRQPLALAIFLYAPQFSASLHRYALF